MSGTTIRIWHQSMTELQELGHYRTTLEEHARRVLPDTTTVSVHGLPEGSYGGLAPSDVLGYPYAYHLVLGHAIEAAYQAEREGYDAFVVGSYSEPFLREIRSLVDIPVASLAEGTLLVGCSLGKYQALIANSPSIERIVSTQVHKHGLQQRVTGVYSLDPPLTENALSAAFRDAGAMIESFLTVARRAVAAGADVVVPAEGVLAELLWANGVDRVDDVPVMDSLGVAWHYAEMMVGLWRRTNLRVGRRWEYPRPPEQVLARVRGIAGLEG